MFKNRWTLRSTNPFLWIFPYQGTSQPGAVTNQNAHITNPQSAAGTGHVRGTGVQKGHWVRNYLGSGGSGQLQANGVKIVKERTNGNWTRAKCWLVKYGLVVTNSVTGPNQIRNDDGPWSAMSRRSDQSFLSTYVTIFVTALRKSHCKPSIPYAL